MKKEWIDICLDLASQPADLWSGCRKIIRNVSFSIENFNHDLKMADCGFTKSKMTMLRKNYTHEESRAAAVDLWKLRCTQAKYGSVGFSCYNHIIKGHGAQAGGGSYWNTINAKQYPKTAKVSRASVMGPCIQSVVLTWIKKDHIEIDVFYRTTELLKKFPADLVFLREELLAPFDLTHLKKVNFHFANVTIHPMYFVTIVPLLGNVEAKLARLKKDDKRFYDWVVKWTARYVCPEHLRGIEKFGQAMRVRMDALNRIKPDALKKFQKYLRDNHPGYRKDYVDPDAGEEDEE